MNTHLWAITTAGDFSFTMEAIKSVPDPDIDILIVDDATPDLTLLKKFCVQDLRTIDILTKDEPKGLTDSWNMAYRWFLTGGYKTFTLSNHDVLFAPKAMKYLREGVGEFDLVGPLSNKPGPSKRQQIKLYSHQNPRKLADVEKEIQQLGPEPTSFLNGFLFSFTDRIKEAAFSRDQLVPDGFVNVGNDNAVTRQMRQKELPMAIIRKAYVFHYKAVITPLTGNRDALWR